MSIYLKSGQAVRQMSRQPQKELVDQQRLLREASNEKPINEGFVEVPVG